MERLDFFPCRLPVCSHIMPRFTRRRRFRRPRRRRRFRGRRRMRRTRHVMDPEIKSTDIFSPVTAIDDLGTRTHINGAPQGVSVLQRQGMQHWNVSSFCSYTIAINAVSNTAVEVRVALIDFLIPRGTFLDLVNVWQGNGSNQAVLGARVLERAPAYRVLWSRTHNLDFAHQSFTRRINRKLGFKTRYVGAAAGFGDITDHSVWLCAISNTGVVADQPTIEFFHRLRFVG